jgi:hypothetical protein
MSGVLEGGLRASSALNASEGCNCMLMAALLEALRNSIEKGVVNSNNAVLRWRCCGTLNPSICDFHFYT